MICIYLSLTDDVLYWLKQNPCFKITFYKSKIVSTNDRRVTSGFYNIEVVNLGCDVHLFIKSQRKKIKPR